MTKVIGKVDVNLMCLVYSFDEADVREAVWQIMSYMYSQNPDIVEIV